MLGGRKRRTVELCRECSHSNRPAFSAARLGHTDCLITAHRQLGALNDRDDDGATPIHYAARNGQLECLTWLASRSNIPPDAVTVNNATAAHDAAAMGHVDCLKFLLENTRCSAADITAEGATTLHIACRFGRLEIVKWLMEYSQSSPSKKGANKVTPVHLCAAKNHLDCLKWLTQHPQYTPNEMTVHGATPVYFAAQEGSLECLQWLVESASGNPYTTAVDGMAPIHAAAQAGQVACIQWLVERAGVSPRHKADDGATPAHFAAAGGQVETLEWILDHGGSLSDRDVLGGTPVHDAAEQGQLDTLSALIRRGADIAVKDFDGMDALDLAQENDHSNCAELLVRATRPNLLVSLTPHHSLSRAAGKEKVTDEEESIQKEKQRQFEEAMLSGVSEERKEGASQQKLPAPLQPGPQLLLSGEQDDSQMSLDKVSLTQLAPASSLRHSRHSTPSRKSGVESKKSSDHTSEHTSDYSENLVLYKPRPALSPRLFEQPDDVDFAPEAKTETTPISASKPHPPQGKAGGVLDSLQLDPQEAARHSPIPKRAKFLKKFKKDKEKGAKKEKKGRRFSLRKDSSSKKPEVSKETVPKQPATKPVSIPEVTVEMEPQDEPMDTTRETPTPLSTEQKPIPVTTEQKPTSSLTEQRPTPVLEPTVDEDVSPYDIVAEKVVGNVMRQSYTMLSQGAEEEDGKGEAVRPATPPPAPPTTEGVVLRPKKTGSKKKKKSKKKQRSSGVKEEAVIKLQRKSDSLKTPDETVTVTFVPRASNVKKSFPVTHRKLLTEDDLSSPDSSEDEVRHSSRISFTTPGFDRLDSRTFEEFGDDITSLEQQRMEKEKEWEGLIGDVPTKHKVGGAKAASKKLDFGADVASVDLPRATPVQQPGDEREGESVMPSAEHKQSSEEPVGTGTSVVEHKPSQGRGEEEKPREVLKLISQLERDKRRSTGGGVATVDSAPTTRATSVPRPPLAGIVRSGSVTEKLKMFGGGVQSPWKQAKPVEKGERGGSRGGGVDQPDADAARLRPKGEQTVPSSTHFDAISEEAKDEKHLLDEELTDDLPPLPKIHPGLARRHSQERLRLDGLPPPDSSERKPKARKSPKASPKGIRKSPPLAKVLQQEMGGAVSDGRGGGVVPQRSPSPKVRKATSVYSPLVVSSDAKQSPGGTGASPAKDRPISAPSPQQNTDVSALYMNSANLPHLNHLRERRHREEAERAGQVVAALLQEPRFSGSKVPMEFQGAWLKERGKAYAWKQRAGSLNALTTLNAVRLDNKSIYIFLKAMERGPILHHVHLWVGSGVSEFATHSAYQHCQKLLGCLSGRPVLHKEYQGHESFAMAEILGGNVTRVYESSPSYLNTDLPKAKLYRFTPESSRFKEIDSELIPELISGSFSLVLDTPTGVFLWLPALYWEREGRSKMALEITDVFLSFCSYPVWTPVTVVTQHGETAEFSAHFLPCPQTDLRLGPGAEGLNLPVVRVSEVSYPVTGQTKIWRVEGRQKQPVPLDQFGQFRSDSLYLIQYNYHKESPLYVWMDSTLYVWVGGAVEGDGDAVKLALKGVDELNTSGRMPVVVVPEGKEPNQLLNLFKGRFTVHSTEPSAEGTHLYRVSGHGTLTLKASELRPHSSSLHSCHAHLLIVKRGGAAKVFVWSGQFSSQAERRGALIFARFLEKGIDPIRLAEGMETYDFWTHLGGKGKHSHFTANEHCDYILPAFYSCMADKSTGHVTFKQSSPLTKEVARSSGCYVVQFRDQLFIWQGSECYQAAPMDVAKYYIAQFHSWKSTRDFLITMAAEGSEGEMFWKWITRLRLADSPEPPPEEVEEEEVEEEGEEEEEEEDEEGVRVDGKMEEIQEEEEEEEKGEGEEGRSLTVEEPTKVEGERTEPVKRERVETDDPSPESRPPLRSPAASQPLPLTKSQEVAFDKVDQLQAAIVAHMASQEETQEREGERAAAVPMFRTSETVKELSDAIEGLDTMMANLTTKPSTSAEHTTTEARQTSLTGQTESDEMTPEPSMDDLMSQSEDNLLDAPSPGAKQSSKKPGKSTHKAPALLVRVEVEGGRVWEVRVRERAPIITVMFKVAQMSGDQLTINSALFEVCDALKIQRALEDHELIGDIVSTWPGKNRPRLVLKDFIAKNVLWLEYPPLSKHQIVSYLKHKEVPDVTTRLHFSPRGSRSRWKTGNFCLKATGVYSILESKKATRMELCAALEYTVYCPIAVKGKTLSAPTPFCFVLKPPTSWHEKEMRLFCAPTYNAMAQWIHTVRLLKYGVQLKANYIAMTRRLQERGQLTDRKDEAQPMATDRSTIAQ